MADVDITRSHSLGIEAARTAVEQVANDLEDELGVDHRWTGNTLQFEGQGAEGHIRVEEETVYLEIDLPFFLQPMSGRVRAEAQDYLDRHLEPK